MKVKQLINIAKTTYLKNLTKSEDTILMFLNLALEELNRRFSFNTRAVVIRTIPEKFDYTVEESDLNLILELYDSNGQLLNTSDVINSTVSDYKLISYNSFILTNPKEDFVTCIYKGSMTELTLEDTIPIPAVFMNAILDYIAFMGHSSLTDNFNETQLRLSKFENTCNALLGEGYRIDLSNESLSIDDKGFV